MEKNNSSTASMISASIKRVSNCEMCTPLDINSDAVCIISSKDNIGSYSADDNFFTCSPSLLCTLDSYFRGGPLTEMIPIHSLYLQSGKCPYFHNPYFAYEIGMMVLPIVKGAFTLSGFPDLQRHNLTGRKEETDYLCEIDNTTYTQLAYNSINHTRNFNFSKQCVPQYCSCNTTYLSSEGHTYETIENTTFVNVKNLLHLQLIYNEIELIESGVFINARHLKIIDFSSNLLKTLPEKIFLPLTELQVLNISFNKMNNSVFGAFKYAPSLEILVLNDNDISEICEQCLEGLRSLKMLNLSHNHIQKLDHLHFLTLLEVLDVSFNDIVKLSEACFHSLTHLRELRLNDNKMKFISNNVFDKNVNLYFLDLSSNKLKSIPNVLLLSSLEELYIDDNRIENITSEDIEMLCNVSTLHYISIYFNYFSSISSEVFNCRHHQLVEVDMSDSGLTDLSIFKKANVLILNAEHNIFKRFSLCDISSEIADLSLGYNLINEWVDYDDDDYSDNCDYQAYKLEYLRLNNNRLKDLSNLQLPPTLQFLDLSRNEIVSISFKNLSEAVALHTVKLDFNKLAVVCHLLPQLSDNVISPTFELSNNPLMCSCEILQLHETNTFLDFYDEQDCPAMLTASFDQHLAYHKAPEDVFYCSNLKDARYCSCNADSRYRTMCGLPCPSECSCYINGHYDHYLVNCTHHNLTYIPAVNFFKLPTTIDFTGNFLDAINSSTMLSYIKAQKVYFTSNRLQTIERNAFIGFDHLQVLDLSFNLLVQLSEDIFRYLKSLRELYLNNNRLKYLDTSQLQPLNHLKILHLHSNLFTDYPVWQLDDLKALTLERLTLTDNPWSCECDYFVKFKKWLIASPFVVSASHLFCATDSNSQIKNHFLSANGTICDGHRPFVMHDQIVVWATSIVLAIVMLIVVILVYFYRKDIQVLIYFRYGVRLFSQSKFNDDDKLFDVFIAYSSEDEEFVAKNLMPGLEEIENPYRVCVHHRNFLVGSPITENILEAVDRSCRTIVVLSESFASSSWCRFEFKTAHNIALCDRVARLIVVVLNDIPKSCNFEMRLYLKNNTYLQWSDKLFWKKLYFALPDNKLSSNRNVDPVT